MRNTPRIMVRPDRVTIQGLVGWTDVRRPAIGVALDTPTVQIANCTADGPSPLEAGAAVVGVP